MKDNDIARLVNNLKQIAVECHGHGSLREKISKLIVPAVKGHTVMEWISVKDDSPKHLQSCLCFRPAATFDRCRVQLYKHGSGFNGLYPVTHWMKLPSVPDEE